MTRLGKDTGFVLECIEYIVMVKLSITIINNVYVIDTDMLMTPNFCWYNSLNVKE